MAKKETKTTNNHPICTLSLGNVYYLKTKIEVTKEDGVSTSNVPKNYPVTILEIKEDTCIVKSEEQKIIFEIEKNKLKEGPETLKENEIYMVYFRSDWRGYFAFSNNIEIAAKNVLKQFNRYCDEKFTFKMLATGEDEYRFYVYKVNIHNLVFDDEYMDIDTRKENSDSNWYIGDYLNKYRKNTNANVYETKFPFEKWVKN